MPICFNDMSRHLSVYITQFFRYVKTRWQNRFSSQNCFLKNHEIIKQNQTFESTIGKPKLIRAPQSLFCSIDWFRPLALEDTNVHFQVSTTIARRHEEKRGRIAETQVIISLACIIESSRSLSR